MLSKLEETIDATIDRKLAKVTEVASYANAVKHLLPTAANDGNTTNSKQVSTDSFQDILKEARKVQLDEERDKKIRSTNLVIHGISESSNEETSERG